ncbi:MAG: methyltransferase domain-containing protein [Symploca sp. SIO1A3]|nr:methyltransferase domain-containing protein [Symploca sp. SIO1A3]
MSQTNFEIRLPEEFGTLAINEEYFFIVQDGKERKLRLHDYAEVYSIPGLYEYLALETLRYQSPRVLSSLLIEQVTQAGGKVEDLTVLEIGAGSGLFGQALANLGVKSITGVDIVPEAAAAAEREYPGIYENYYAEDLANLNETVSNNLTTRGFNCLVCCSALSSGHIPHQALTTALKMIVPYGWIAFNVAKDIWENQGEGGFVQLHPWVAQTDMLELVTTYAYQHRIYMDGRPLEYIAVIGRKQS